MIEATKKSIVQSCVETCQPSTAPAIFQSKNGSHYSTIMIPIGTKDELECSLVEHTLKICEYLESEQRQTSGGKSKLIAGELHVNMPHVEDIGVLGIKWQHLYKRGFGRKGVVGNSGWTISEIKPGKNSPAYHKQDSVA